MLISQHYYMKLVMRLAAIYNIIWGAWVVLFPSHFFNWANIAVPSYLGIWQSVGMIVGVYGLGYWCSSYNVYIHWPIIMVGYLGKIFGPIGFLWALNRGQIAPQFGYINITNDLIWLLPFSLILLNVYKANKFSLCSIK